MKPYETCLQCGESGPAWDRATIRCHACGFDDAAGFCPVPAIFEQFARQGLALKPSDTMTVETLAAEYRRVFKTPEAMAQTWEFMRQHPQEMVDMMKKADAQRKDPH